MMRTFRGVVLVIVAVLALLGGTAATANANPGSFAFIADEAASSTADPGDPGFPPDE